MSHKATGWAVEQRGLSAAQFRVLVVLADHHNPAYGCFPDQDQLATNCEMSERTVRECLSSLEDRGLITRERVSGKFGQRVGTRYFLAFESLPENSAGRSPTGKMASSLPAESRNPYRQNLPVYNKDESVKEPVKEPVKDSSKGGSTSDLFEEELSPEKPYPVEPSGALAVSFNTFELFWNIYALKKSKPAAERAWKAAVKRTAPAAIMEGLARAKQYDTRFRDKQFTPHASTWLNARGWEDEHDTTATRGHGRQTHSIEGSREAFDLADALLARGHEGGRH